MKMQRLAKTAIEIDKREKKGDDRIC